MSKCIVGDHLILRNAYWCSNCEWYLCWDHLKKAALTNAIKCPKCGHDVKRVDRLGTALQSQL